MLCSAVHLSVNLFNVVCPCDMFSAPCHMLCSHCDMLPSSCDMMYSHHAPLELTFDTGRFVPESYSSSPGEASTPGSLHREAQESEPVAGVPIADLLVRAVGEM